MTFFDTYGNNGDIVSQVLNDVLLIQSALSEKVGNYIHYMTTFVSGLVIGFINCWQIALITFAVGPFIVAAGDSWLQVGFVLTTSINSAYVLGYSAAVMVPLGWAGGVVGLILATAISLYANALIAKLHEFEGKRHIRYRDLAGFIYGPKALLWILRSPHTTNCPSCYSLNLL